MTTALRVLAFAAALLGAVGTTVAEGVQLAYRHQLSDFGGTIPFMGARVRVDDANDETYVLEGNSFRVFGPSGMEIYSATLDPAGGNYHDVAFDGSGDLFLLGVRTGTDAGGTAFFVERCDFRGEPKERIHARALPEKYWGFAPNYLVMHDGRFVLVDASQLTVLVLGRTGTFERALDLAPLFEVKDGERGNLEIGGFAIDPKGNMLFTLPARFTAFVVSPDGRVASFGRGGSRAGQFGVVAGIAGDLRGNIYVADKIRAVVMVFDKDFRFLTETGGYGDRPENLVGPAGIALSASGKLFVTQIRKRGVSVFDIAS